MQLPARLQELIDASSITTSFVVDSQGKSVNEMGNSSGIGNQTDMLLLRTLRAHAQIVLTSGLTARADSYKMPRVADLAIFTQAGVSGLQLKPKPNQQLHLINQHMASSYLAALQHLLAIGYRRIHVEFGETGLAELLDQIELCVISSRNTQGPKRFLTAAGILEIASFSLPDLYIAVGSGRGKG